MELINRIRKNRKGFTLVEIIVVLVILAILAAFTIPTMLGFVGDAKGKAYIAEAREVYVAAQSTATQYSATDGVTDGDLSSALGSASVQAATESAATVTGAPGTAKASYQMQKYIGTDLTIFTGAIPSPQTATSNIGSNSAWTVIVGSDADATSKALKTAKVSTLNYYKNGYQVTINGGNASVKKLY